MAPASTPPSNKYSLTTFTQQSEFSEAVFSGRYSSLCFGGDIRSGKTVMQLGILTILCKLYPGSRWFVIRRDRDTLKRNTIPSFHKYCSPPGFFPEFNKSDLIATAINGSQIAFMSEAGSSDPELNRFKGLEANGFLLEQAEELREETYQIAIQRAGQWRLDPMPPMLILLNVNPNDSWPRVKFYEPWQDEKLAAPFYFQLARLTDNPWIAPEYIDTLRKTLPPAVFARYCEGKWDAIDAPMQLVSWEVIHACKERRETKDQRRYMGVDVGREGKDPSVWYVGEGPNIIARRVEEKTKTTECRDITIQMMVEYSVSAEYTCLDSVGLGAGVIDELDEKGFECIPFVGGTKCNTKIPGTEFHFINHRSWANWITAEAMKKNNVGNFSERKLLSDCGAIRYIIKDDKGIKIESKEKFRDRTHRSSDDWDAFYMSQWARFQDEIMPQPGMFSL